LGIGFLVFGWTVRTQLNGGVLLQHCVEVPEYAELAEITVPDR